MMGILLIIAGLGITGFAAYSWFTDYKKSPQDGRVDTLNRDKYSPDMGRWAAKRERVVSKERGDLAGTLNTEGRYVADMYKNQAVAEENKYLFDTTPQRMQMQTERLESDHEVYLETQATRLSEQKLTQQMIQVAQQLGLPYEVFVQILSKAKLDELELKKLAAEKRITLEAGFIYQLRGFHQLMMMRKEIDGLIVEIEQIKRDKSLPEGAKKRQIVERELDIQTLQEKRDAERKRLVQTDNGRRLGTGD